MSAFLRTIFTAYFELCRVVYQQSSPLLRWESTVIDTVAPDVMVGSLDSNLHHCV